MITRRLGLASGALELKSKERKKAHKIARNVSHHVGRLRGSEKRATDDVSTVAVLCEHMLLYNDYIYTLHGCNSLLPIENKNELEKNYRQWYKRSQITITKRAC